MSSNSTMDTELRGIPVSSGVGIGRAYLVDRRRAKTPRRHIDAGEVSGEVARFRHALDDSDEQLELIKQKLSERSEAEQYNIIEAHQLILRDEHLVDATERYIRDELINAEWALRKTVEHIKGVFDAIEDDYFRERRSDVDFVGERVMRSLLGENTGPVLPPPDAVVIAFDLSPADTAQLHRAAVSGLLTEAGGKTSHTAIIARAHEIPAVVGLEGVTELVETGDLVIVDGASGIVIVNPSAPVVARYRDKRRRQDANTAALLSNRDWPAVTLDGVRVALLANVDLGEEVESAIAHGAEGVGLMRSEFLFLTRSELPTEDDHYQSVCEVTRACGALPATVRTFDLGSDKISALVGMPDREENPALGLRSTRLSLSEQAMPLFRTQLRGILRAASCGVVRIMFPMISGVAEFLRAREMVDAARRSLEAEGVSVPEVEVGIMIEMPSAAVIPDLLAKHCDFFSIGTNDLIQYTLAVDRVNEHVGYLYEPLHPSILRLIRDVAAAAAAAQIGVSVCGEMAGDPVAALVLIGLGVRELSLNAVSIPEVKNVIRRTRASDLSRLVDELFAMDTAKEIRTRAMAFLDQIMAEAVA